MEQETNISINIPGLTNLYAIAGFLLHIMEDLAFIRAHLERGKPISPEEKESFREELGKSVLAKMERVARLVAHLEREYLQSQQQS